MRVGVPPLELVPGKVLVVGRTQDCDLCVPSKQISRRHAELRWSGPRAILVDLGSQNGTLVNGRPIHGEHRLEDGDELEFGPYMCTFRSEGGEAPAADGNDLTQPMLSDAMAGRLDQIDLAELLQTLELNTKTGTLEVFGPDGEGSIVLQSGTPVYAEAGAERGEAAVFALLALGSGQFSFSGDVPAVERNVNAPTRSLVAEAARRRGAG